MRPRGFTLVELLVVIGIIALLISILLPALSKAREQAKLAQCSSNMRQLAQAVFIYETENGGSYPPAWTSCQSASPTSPSLGAAQPPVLFELLTALPQWGPEYVNVRTCPEVVDIFGGIPQILTPTAAAAQAAFSYKYNYLLGGCDTNDPYTNLGHPTYNAANQLFYSHPFRYVPNASETAMFIDYPQLWACALSSETPTPDNRGFKLVDGVPGAFRVAPGSVASAGNGGFLEPNIFSSDTTFHQTIDDLAPVHNISVAKNAKNLGTGYPAMTGIINVAYCDGSVRGVSVTQGQTPTSSPAKDTFYEQTTVTASGSAGYQLQSTVGIIPGTRFDPMLAP